MLRLDRPAAVKTGTTNDFRDNLTVGYTPQLVTGVWVGNADNSPMINISGVAGAGPIWNQFMTVAHSGVAAAPLCRRWACASSRSAPTLARCPATPARKSASTGSPKIARRCPRAGSVAAHEDGAGEQRARHRVYAVGPDRRACLQGLPGAVSRMGRSQRHRAAAARRPQRPIRISSQVTLLGPTEGMVVSGQVPVYGNASVPEFASYQLEYGISHDPGAFSLPIYGPVNTPVINAQLGWWDVSGLDERPAHAAAARVRRARRALRRRGCASSSRIPAAHARTEMTPTWTPEPMPPTATWTPEPSSAHGYFHAGTDLDPGAAPAYGDLHTGTDSAHGHVHPRTNLDAGAAARAAGAAACRDAGWGGVVSCAVGGAGLGVLGSWGGGVKDEPHHPKTLRPQRLTPAAVPAIPFPDRPAAASRAGAGSRCCRRSGRCRRRGQRGIRA
jgi:hypothetical protein